MPKIISPERLSSALNDVINEHYDLGVEKTNRAVRKTVIRIWGNIIKLTPVGNPDLWKSKAPAGYVGGRARGNWFMGSEHIQKVGGVNASKNANYIAKNTPVNILARPLYLYNNMPYINRLEYGSHSSQAPKGMVRVSLLKWRKELQKNFKAEY